MPLPTGKVQQCAPRPRFWQFLRCEQSPDRRHRQTGEARAPDTDASPTWRFGKGNRTTAASACVFGSRLLRRSENSIVVRDWRLSSSCQALMLQRSINCRSVHWLHWRSILPSCRPQDLRTSKGLQVEFSAWANGRQHAIPPRSGKPHAFSRHRHTTPAVSTFTSGAPEQPCSSKLLTN